MTSRMMTMWINILRTLVLLYCVSCCHGNQTALLADLFGSYSNEIRPICGADVPIEVKVGIAVRQVLDLDEPQQTMKANIWIRLKWTDCKLTWNASDYGGIDTLIIPYSKIWSPDLTLYDNADDGLPGVKDYRASVQSDGTVSYNFPTILNSICRIDVTSFPFDTQSCPLPFGSWAFHGLQLNITSMASAGDMTSFKSNSEWDLVGVPVERHVVYYGCCPEPFPDVTFYIRLSRKPLFYMFNLIFPCLLISAIALLGFLLPPDSGEKVSLEITVLLSLSVFMLVVTQTLPPTSEDFPIIGIYFGTSLIVATLSTVLSVVVINVHFRGQLGHEVPPWIRKAFLGNLAQLLRVRHDAAVQPVFSRSVTVVEPFKDDLMVSQINRKTPGFDGQITQTSMTTPLQAIQQAAFTGVPDEQLSILRKFAKQNDEKNKAEQMDEEWKTVAVVLDRLFLIIISLFLVITTAVILLIAAS